MYSYKLVLLTCNYLFDAKEKVVEQEKSNSRKYKNFLPPETSSKCANPVLEIQFFFSNL